jgi:dTDP-4-dehydrorhamnose reductase
MNHVLLLGGSGMLGSVVLRLLNSENFDYVAPTSLDLDIRDSAQLFKFVSDFRPSWIINCAAWTNVDGAESHFQDAMNLNAHAVGNIGKVALELESRVIHISTDYVFEGMKSIPYTESDATNPLNAYGKTKLAGEFALKENLESDSFLIRTSWLYGPTGKNFAKTMIRKALSQDICSVVADQNGTPTSAIDLARGIIDLVRNPVAPGIYHYSNLGQATWFDFAQKIYELTSTDPDLVRACLTSELSQVALRPTYSVLNKNKWIETKLSMIPEWQVSLELAMPKLLDAIRNEIS